MNALDLTYERFKEEEGVRKFAYNDATGKRVTCQPGGNLSIAIGVNLETGLDDEEVEWISRHRLQKVAQSLALFNWFQNCDPYRQSVLLDIGFNAGVGGLLNFKEMIKAIERQDWERAETECMVTNPAVQGRYQKLGKILRVGGPNG